MCLAIPGKLIDVSIDEAGVRMGRANFGGIVKQVCLEYTPEVNTGDYVLVHVGFALSKVDEVEARRTYEALANMQQLGELETPDFAELERRSAPGASEAAGAGQRACASASPPPAAGAPAATFSRTSAPDAPPASASAS